MTESVGVYTAEVARTIHERVIGAVRSQPGTRVGVNHTGTMYYGVLNAALSAASNPLTGWTQVEVRLLRYVRNSDNRNMEVVPGKEGLIKATNRSMDLSADRKTMCIIQQLNEQKSEWVIVWLDCKPSTITIPTVTITTT